MAVDLAVVGACCGLLFLSFNPVFGVERRALWMPAAAVLALLAVIEVAIGITPGKAIARLTVRVRGGVGRAGPMALILRGTVRWAPVGLFLVTCRTADRLAWMLGVQVLIVLIGCYLTVCYMALWRRGITMFDAIAGTIVVRK